jgi:hypothetical protein
MILTTIVAIFALTTVVIFLGIAIEYLTTLDLD